MSETSTVVTIRSWATAQRQVAILAAIIVAIPTTYGFQSAVDGDAFAGSFFLLMTLAVGVPSAYDDYWPHYDQTSKAVAWVLAACAVAAVEFTALYLAGTALIDISWVAPVGAFSVTYLGNLAVLAAWQRCR
ncbi:hypothetical protein [Halorubrum laminariae]|uniref:Holin n=1 Tax=Halorubrum laminariae TaxID=1433523 RepID=A0ABD6C0C0_9EURY|nr:hypothetical protein [Halorubrum laminariae]